MARKYSKIELRRLITSYLNDPRSVDFSRLSLEQKRELLALAYHDCYKIINSKAYGIGSLIAKFFAEFEDHHMADLKSEDKVKQLFAEITNANKYGVEYPVKADEMAGLEKLKKDLRGFKIKVDRTTGDRKIDDDVQLMNDAELDSAFTSLLGIYREAYSTHSRFSNINTICVDEPSKARKALKEYDSLGDNVSHLDMDAIRDMLKNHKYVDVKKVIDAAIKSYRAKGAGPAPLTPGTPPKTTKKDGFLKRLGKWALRRPVLAGTIIFAAALPVAGVVSLTTLPSFFLWGSVGLAVGGNGLKAIAKAVIPGYKRFIYNYDIDRVESKLAVNRAKQEKLMTIVRSKIKRNPAVTLDNAREYVSPDMSSGVVAWFKGMKGLINSKKAQKTKERILDGVGAIDISGVDKAHIKEIAKLARQEERLLKKGNRKYSRLINKADIADVDAYRTDSARRDAMNTGTLSAEDSKTVKEIREKSRKKKATVEGYKKAVENTESAAMEVVREYFSRGKVRDALEYVADDMDANEGKQNPELMKIVREKVGTPGIQYLAARKMETVVGSGKYMASEKALEYIEAKDADKSAKAVTFTETLAATYGDYYYRTKKSKKDLKTLMEPYGDRCLKNAQDAYEEAKKEETTPPPRFLGDDFFEIKK